MAHHKNGSPVLRILQLTDIHIDFEYRVGARANCDQPLCCRHNDEQLTQNSSISSKPIVPAGFWGDYHSCT